MAVDLSKIVAKRKIQIDELNGKVVAIDAYNVLYQFISSIRQPDGSPLTDSKGNVTSHLSGILYRTTELIEHGVKPVYVFDGIPSMLKRRTIEARMKRRADAETLWKQALEKGDTEGIRTFSHASAKVNKEIADSAKRLLDLMGVACINAPSEGEAQASIMCKNGLVYAVGSQDYDTLMFGAPLVVRNMTITGRRKLPGKNIFINVETEIMSLEDTLKQLGINNRQLIWIGIMLGTDFNEGINGIGPKTAIKIVKDAKSIADIKNYIKNKYDREFDMDVEEVERLFTNPEVIDVDGSELEHNMAKAPDRRALIEFMCNQHDFSKERMEKPIDRLEKQKSKSKQSGIGGWISK